MSKEFKPGQEVFHRNLGKGVFIGYDLHDEEVIVEFTDEDGYKDELRVSTGLLSNKETI
ncbi:hypothetical protein [Lysinibacillus sp.]|uniref:hypothetical protein n=1 Tax=Lysinibacillus sp. TaxID=1869345 RepID=UPI0028B19DF0|nr:hypothetical protein [Lysinibacillus sp.]